MKGLLLEILKFGILQHVQWLYRFGFCCIALGSRETFLVRFIAENALTELFCLLLGIIGQ